MKSLIKKALCLLAMLVVGFLGKGLAYRSRPVHFDTVADVRELAIEAGLHWHWENGENRPNGNLFVSVHSLDWAQLVEPQKFIPAKKAEWRDTVWIIPYPSTLCFDEASPNLLGASLRRWGNVIVGGDDQIMDRIEQFYRNR